MGRGVGVGEGDSKTPYQGTGAGRSVHMVLYIPSMLGDASVHDESGREGIPGERAAHDSNCKESGKWAGCGMLPHITLTSPQRSMCQGRQGCQPDTWLWFAICGSRCFVPGRRRQVRRIPIGTLFATLSNYRHK